MNAALLREQPAPAETVPDVCDLCGEEIRSTERVYKSERNPAVHSYCRFGGNSRGNGC